MTDVAPVPYVFSEHGPRRTNRVIRYSDSGEPVYRNVHRNTWGQPELILEATDVATIRVILEDRLEDGEFINEVTAAADGATAEIEYDASNVWLTLSCVMGPALVSMHIRFSTRETLVLRVAAKLHCKLGQPDVIGRPPFQRGIV